MVMDATEHNHTDIGDRLTLRQRRVLEAFRCRDHGETATLMAVGRELGISHAGVHDHLVALKKKGYATKVRYDGPYEGRWRVK